MQVREIKKGKGRDRCDWLEWDTKQNQFEIHIIVPKRSLDFLQTPIPQKTRLEQSDSNDNNLKMVVSDSPNGGSTPPPPQQEQANKDRFTKPISIAGPTEADLNRNTELEKVSSFIVYFHAFTSFLRIKSNKNSFFVVVSFSF